MEPMHDSPRQRRPRWIVYAVILPLAVLLLGLEITRARERSSRTMRLSDVHILCHYLELYAEEHGKYPPNLAVSHIVGHPAIPRMEYLVADQPWPVDENVMLFKERDASYYWFVQDGRWEAYRFETKYIACE